MQNHTIRYQGQLIGIVEPIEPSNYGTDGGIRYSARGLRDDSTWVKVIWEGRYADHRDDGRGGCSVAGCAVNHDDGETACDWEHPIAVYSMEE